MLKKFTTMRSAGGTAVFLMLLLAGQMKGAGSSVTQNGVPLQTMPQTTTAPKFPSMDREDPTNPVREKMESQRARMLNDDRRKHLLSDTEKLVQLSAELKEEVGKSSKDELSVTVVRKAGEIERLAHDVKLRMVD